MTTLYGRSDIQAVTHTLPDGKVFTAVFGKKTDRVLAPGYGRDDRSIPKVTTNDAALVAWLKSQGWVDDAALVELTADERRAEEKAMKQGQMLGAAVAEGLGREMARQAATDVKKA